MLTPKGFVFDLDGVLIDTEKLACAAYMGAARLMGLELTREQFLSMIGLDLNSNKRILKAAFGESFSFDEFRVHARKLRENETIEAKAGAEDILQFAKQRKIACAVATSTYTEIAKERLAGVKLLQYIDEVVGGDQVKNGKPHPEIFQTAAKALKLFPSECLGFEDSDHGLISAHAAGLHVIHVPDLKQLDAGVTAKAVSVQPSLNAARLYIEERYFKSN